MRLYLFHVSSPRVRLTGLTRYTQCCFPENPRDLRKFPGTLRFGYSSHPATLKGRKECQLTRQQKISPSGPKDNLFYQRAGKSFYWTLVQWVIRPIRGRNVHPRTEAKKTDC